MVDELRKRYDDRFSHYFDPERVRASSTRPRAASSPGVGLTVNEVPRGPASRRRPPGLARARRADIAVGDVDHRGRRQVDRGRSVRGRDRADQGRAGHRGRADDRALERRRRARTVTVERAEVRLPVADGRIVRVDGRRGRATSASSASASGAHGELRQRDRAPVRARGRRASILDLRGNGGGLLQEAVLSASIFVEEGDVVTTRSRTQGEKVYDATGGALDPRADRRADQPRHRLRGRDPRLGDRRLRPRHVVGEHVVRQGHRSRR